MANTHLVIVESPSKAGTIKSYLGASYKVTASVGHVRDLPKSSLGIDIENNFEPHYINIRGKSDIIKSLISDSKKADIVYLATDPDREGEAISWHLANTLKLDPSKIKRITFNEISKTAVKAAIKEPRDIDMNLVNSQQARRLLDRIVGYKLSPFLWKNVRSGLSAGRVQSAAVRILTERENEIKAFVSSEYWSLTAHLKTPDNKSFTARFWGDSKKAELKNEEETQKVISELTDNYTVSSVKKSVKIKNPSPPFITSTLQQEAYRKLSFQSSKTMKIAQELYEGINLGSALGGTHGLITYMRTDSQRVSDTAKDAARDYIKREYGDGYCPKTPRNYKTANSAQDAHEAIRPVSTEYAPSKIRKSLSNDQYKLYSLIWDRFIASQMSSATFDTVNADVANGKYIFKASGMTPKFKGFLALYEEGLDSPSDDDEKTTLPELVVNMKIHADSLEPAQHFTEAPPRFTEATLIKFLEEKRIGRPSTYATIINTIISRDYVRREGKSLTPTPLAFVTTQVITEYFPEIVDYHFTANMEDKLDAIETGTSSIVGVLSDFYGNFSKELDEAMNAGEKIKVEVPAEETELVCDNCGRTMIVKSGRFGRFAACPNYPECKCTKRLTKDGKPAVKKESDALPEITDKICEKCGAPLIQREGRYGKFYACSKFPKCDYTLNIQTSLGIPCPKCGKDTVVKHGKKRVFYGCSGYPDCDFMSWDMPTNEKCPQCGEMLYLKKAGNTLVCHKNGCNFKKSGEEK